MLPAPIRERFDLAAHNNAPKEDPCRTLLSV